MPISSVQRMGRVAQRNWTMCPRQRGPSGFFERNLERHSAEVRGELDVHG